MNQAEIKRRQIQAVSIILTLITLAVIARVIGYNGVTYTAAAVEIFAMLWLVVGGNLTEALGRLLRIRNSKGQHRNAARLKRNTAIFQLVFGLAGSVALLAGADWIAGNVLQVQYSTFILMVLSPTVFLRTASAVLLGCFQGDGSEFPTAAAGILRQIFILGFSLLFGRMLADYGSKVSLLLGQENFTSMYGGVGVAIAVSVSEALIVVFLFLIYQWTRRSKEFSHQEGMRAVDSFADSMYILWSARGMQWLTELLFFLPIPLGILFFQKGTAYDVSVEYGIYLSGYWVLCGCLIALIMIPLLPVCARVMVLLRKEEQRFAKTVFQSGVHIGVVHAAFAAMFTAVMAPQIGAILCSGQEQAVEQMLRGGSLVILFLALSTYLGRLLILLGSKLLVLGSAGIGVVAYVVMLAVLLNRENTGVLALVYAGLMGVGVFCLLLGTFAYRQMRTRLDWLQVMVLPAGAAAVSGLICMLLGRLFTPHLGALVTVIVTFVISFCLYWALLILLRGFRETELDVIPGGRLIRAVGQMLRVF